MSPIENLIDYCTELAVKAKAAAAKLASIPGENKIAWLNRSAELLGERSVALSEANQLDIAKAPEYGLTDAQIDRLRLTPERVESMATGLREVALLPDPVGRIIDSNVRPNGLVVEKVQVPLGVVFFIYESRPNVTADAAALCVKSGNAVILRGGKEAVHSNMAIAGILAEAAAECGLPREAVQLVETTDRAVVGHLLKMPEYIDVVIPRGGEGLIRRVSEEAKMPVIKHYAGNCHVYIDKGADPEKAVELTVNSKCQRLGVCNAAESLVIHAAVLDTLWPRIAEALKKNGIELRCDARSKAAVSGAKDATEEDYAEEYLAKIISVKTVDSLDEAIEHINRYSSGHTEAIVTDDINAARAFATRADSSAVMVNASTRFNDGGQFGLGAEIGISTDKFHARGPCGLNELTSYKYVVYGNGQCRS